MQTRKRCSQDQPFVSCFKEEKQRAMGKKKRKNDKKWVERRKGERREKREEKKKEKMGRRRREGSVPQPLDQGNLGFFWLRKLKFLFSTFKLLKSMIMSSFREVCP